jgi:thiamine biosynthesis lipoprotein
MKKLLILCSLCIFLAACNNTPESIRLTGGTMGTTWSLVIAEPDLKRDLETLHADIAALLVEVNSSMSTWQPESEISIFNQRPPGCMQVSESFIYVVGLAQQISESTQGAYDVTVGPLIDLWGFGVQENTRQPAEPEISSALERVGFHKIEVANGQLCKKTEGVEINLSSIAKGYGVDRMADYLHSLGIENFLAEIGGELMASGSHFGNQWRVGVELPEDGLQQSVARAVEVSNQGLATSGDYRNYFELDGKRYAHIIDPRTGLPVEGGAASATVIANNVTIADGWATALLAMPFEKAFALAEQQNLAALFILRSEQGFDFRTTVEWRNQFDDI